MSKNWTTSTEPLLHFRTNILVTKICQTILPKHSVSNYLNYIFEKYFCKNMEVQIKTPGTTVTSTNLVPQTHFFTFETPKYYNLIYPA